MAEEDVENPGYADAVVVKAAAASAWPSQLRRHPGMSFVACMGITIAFLVHVACMILFVINHDSPSHPTRTAGIVVGFFGMVSGLFLECLFIAVCVHLSFV